jgi:hypothetical protein
MSVKGKAKLLKDPQRGWVLVPIDLDNMKAQAVEKFIKHDTTVSVILDMEFKRPHVEKTLSQLGYLHAAVWPVFYQYYINQGQPAESKEQKEGIRNDVKHAIGFVYLRQDLINRDGPQGEQVVRSFADASKDETSEQIEKIIRLAADFGMIVPGPEEYLEKHGAKDFES